MRTLVYKRTHSNDPDEKGRFGICDCMGRIRRSEFEAVIGIGGRGHEPQMWGIDGKLNWIGIGPHKTAIARLRGPIVTFDHFRYFEREGDVIFIKEVAPNLARRMYKRHAPRSLIDDFNDAEQADIEHLLKMARNAPPSKAWRYTSRLPRRQQRRCPKPIC